MFAAPEPSLHSGYGFGADNSGFYGSTLHSGYGSSLPSGYGSLPFGMGNGSAMAVILEDLLLTTLLPLLFLLLFLRFLGLLLRVHIQHMGNLLFPLGSLTQGPLLMLLMILHNFTVLTSDLLLSM